MKTFELDQIRLASPCTADWNAMAGDDRSRFCSHCSKHVYNFAAMTRAEAETLIEQQEGKLCGRLFRRADGTVLTADCPVGVATLRGRLYRAWAGLALITVAGFICVLNAFGQNRWTKHFNETGPLTQIRESLQPRSFALGGICLPPRTMTFVPEMESDLGVESPRGD